MRTIPLLGSEASDNRPSSSTAGESTSERISGDDISVKPALPSTDSTRRKFGTRQETPTPTGTTNTTTSSEKRSKKGRRRRDEETGKKKVVVPSSQVTPTSKTFRPVIEIPAVRAHMVSRKVATERSAQMSLTDNIADQPSKIQTRRHKSVVTFAEGEEARSTETPTSSREEDVFDSVPNRSIKKSHTHVPRSREGTAAEAAMTMKRKQRSTVVSARPYSLRSDSSSELATVNKIEEAAKSRDKATESIDTPRMRNTKIVSNHDDVVKEAEIEEAQVTADGDDCAPGQIKGEDEDGDDQEGMDMKARALTNLLKTSSVFVAIMAEKMRNQQRKQRETAQRKAAKERAKGMIASGVQQDVETTTTTSKPNTAANKKETAAAKDKDDITNYLDKTELEIPQNNESVQAALAKAADEFEQKPSVLGEQDLVATQQPALVTGGQMKEYQLEGLEWLKSLWMNGLCGILADEMGLGKTVQAISLIAFFKEHKISGPFLIASPLSTVSNWVDEFARWTPSIKTILYHGSKEERAVIRRKQMKMQDQRKHDFPVVCTSYEICMNDRKFLSKYQWKYIIVDEGHRLKNFNCRLIKELLTYNSANRLLMTGTPLQNNIAELWSLLHFLLPDIFNDLNSFQNWFDFSSVLDLSGQKQAIEGRKNSLVSTMHAILKPFLLRRVKTDVETSLPRKREYILYAPLTSEQKELYLEIRNGTSRHYLEQQAVERLERKRKIPPRLAKDLKRKTGADEISSSTDGTPRSSRSGTPTTAKRPRQSYKPMGDREFMRRLRKMELGEEVTDEEEEDEPDECGKMEIERKKTIQLAKKEIGAKKLQNPVMQARLACNSPHNFYWPWDDDRVDDTLVTCSGKMLLLERLVPRLMEKGHKILIFSQFKTQLDILQDWATQLHSWKCCRVDGGVAQVERRELIKAFSTDPSYKIFLLSTRAGGQGINLTAADTVILYDSDWNPQQDLQAQDRAHRIGQTKPVIVYRLATKNTIEQTLLEKADSKRRLEKLVIQKGKFKGLLDSSTAPEGGDEFRQALGEEDGFEIIDVGNGTTSDALLSDRDLETITDRSDEAYERAEKGLEEGGEAFKVVETKKGSETVSLNNLH
ncbi:hypothetical protein KEM54_000227 [Ascosphaera aggregata]|nr:hypothetical protein KEM54_000227 [Ascosphaera aggregata]